MSTSEYTSGYERTSGYGRHGFLPFGRPFAIIITVLAFIAWWPLGLAALFFMLWSGKMGCGYGRGYDRWERKLEGLQSKMDRVRERMGGGAGGGGFGWTPPSSGNRAFDEYRSDTLKRLEDEQKEFRDFLERLRFAKDRAEFDQFMNERRNRPEPGAPQQA